MIYSKIWLISHHKTLRLKTILIIRVILDRVTIIFCPLSTTLNWFNQTLLKMTIQNLNNIKTINPQKTILSKMIKIKLNSKQLIITLLKNWLSLVEIHLFSKTKAVIITSSIFKLARIQVLLNKTSIFKIMRLQTIS